MNKTARFGFGSSLKVKKIPAPMAPLSWRIKNALRSTYISGWIATFIIAPIARFFNLMVFTTELRLRLIKRNGEVINYGVVGRKLVTDVFRQFFVDQLIAESSVFGDFKYHDSGLGSTAEDATDTDIETSDGLARVTGTQVEHDTTTYKTIGQITYDATKTITEHGIFNDPTAGTLCDRTVFGGVAVDNGDKIEFDWRLATTGS